MGGGGAGGSLLTRPLVSVGVGGGTAWAGSVGCARGGWVSRVGGVGRVVSPPVARCARSRAAHVAGYQ